MVNVPLRHRPPPPHHQQHAQRRPANANRPAPPAPRQPRWPYYATAILLGLVLAGVGIGRFIERVRDDIAFEGKSADSTPVTITLGTQPLSVPGNMIRFPAQRRSGPAERLDLFMDWPRLQGLTAANAATFRDVEPAAPIIFLTLVPGQGETPIARLEGLYGRLFTGGSWAGPDGLVGRGFDPASAYAGEELYYEAATTMPFLARCLTSGTATISATCLAEFTRDGLVVSYRFDKSLLGDWRNLDARLKQRVGGFFGR